LEEPLERDADLAETIRDYLFALGLPIAEYGRGYTAEDPNAGRCVICRKPGSKPEIVTSLEWDVDGMVDHGLIAGDADLQAVQMLISGS
jgi:hypothetical protein